MASDATTETKDGKKGKDKEAKKGADAATTAPTTALVPAPEVSDALALSTLSDEDLLKVAEAKGQTYEDLWTKITDKDSLVGVGFFVLDVDFRPDGDFGPYVTIHGRTMNRPGRPGYRFVMSDGSTGVNQQLRDMAASSADGKLKLPMPCFKGLRKSPYMYEDPQTGEKKPSATYYLDGSKN